MTDQFDVINQKVQAYLGLSTRPVGVRLIRQGEPVDPAFPGRDGSRQSFCWYIHEAAGGKDFVVRREDLDCNKAEIVLGFREPLFANLEPRIRQKTAALLIGPVAESDVVMLVLNAEQAMTLGNVLPSLEVMFRKNRTVCGDGMAHVYNSGEATLTLLCIGARTDGAFEPHELLVTLPYKTFVDLPARMSKLGSLSRQTLESLKRRLGRPTRGHYHD